MKRFSINPISIVIWIWLVVMNGFLVAISYFFAIFFHEIGHFLTAKLKGYKVSKFSLSPYGVELGYFDQNINYRDEFFIALAGPLVNLLTVVFVVSFWWIFPSTYFLTESFVYISFIIALFNLLPAYPLDGGRMFVCVASNFVSQKVAKKITIYLNALISAMFFILFVVCLFVNFNPSLLLFSFFLFAGIIDLRFISKYEKINVFSKAFKNFSKPTIYCVNEETCLSELVCHLQTSKTVIYCVLLENGKIVNISEKMVRILATNYPYEIKLKYILNKK